MREAGSQKTRRAGSDAWLLAYGLFGPRSRFGITPGHEMGCANSDEELEELWVTPALSYRHLGFFDRPVGLAGEGELQREISMTSAKLGLSAMAFL